MGACSSKQKYHQNPAVTCQLPDTPNYWTKSNAKYRTIDITNEADFIKTLVYSLWNAEEVGVGKDAPEVGNKRYIKIRKVERVENEELFQKYYEKRTMLQKKKDKVKRIKDLAELHDSGILTTGLIRSMPLLRKSPLEEGIYHDINEHYLFHGTRNENIDSICQDGLQIELASTGLFGKGIYAAEDPTKSDQYTDHDGSKGKKILLCRIDLGEMYLSQRPASELKSPPCRTRHCYKPNCTEHKHTFDSAVGAIPGSRFREFIVYRDHRIYPEYIITYDRIQEKPKRKKIFFYSFKEDDDDYCCSALAV